MMMILLFQLAGCLSLTAQGIEDLSFGTETTLEIMRQLAKYRKILHL